MVFAIKEHYLNWRTSGGRREYKCRYNL